MLAAVQGGWWWRRCSAPWPLEAAIDTAFTGLAAVHADRPPVRG